MKICGLIIIAPSGIRKIVDDAFLNRPDIDAMLNAISILPQIVRESKLGEEHDSYNKGKDDVRRPENGINPDQHIFRFFGAIKMEGDIYRVKLTVKRDNNTNIQRVYTYEIMKMELTSGNTSSENSETPTPVNSITFA